jgi:hypothetical protein
MTVRYTFSTTFLKNGKIVPVSALKAYNRLGAFLIATLHEC